MKKYIIIISIVLIVIVGYLGYGYYKNKNNNKLPKYLKQNSNKVFKSKKERDKYINEFQSNSKTAEDKNMTEITENATGDKDIKINLAEEFIKVMDLDTSIQYESVITSEIKLLPQMNDDTKGKTKEELNNYLMNNKETLLQNYGIETIQELQAFINKLKYLNNTQIIRADKISQFVRKGNNLKFELKIITASERNQIYKLNIVDRLNTKDYLIIWE